MKKMKKPISMLLVLSMLVSTFLFANIFSVQAATYAYGMDAPDKTLNATAKFQSTTNQDDYVQIKYPSVIYMDKTENLQQLGYTYQVQWHYGDSNSYRVAVSDALWGGNSAPKNATNHGPADRVLLDTAFTGYGASNNNYAPDNWLYKNVNNDVLLGYGDSSDVTVTLTAKGTPKSTGTFNYKTTNDSFIAAFQHYEYKFPSNQWVTKNDNNFTSRADVNMTFYIYDKSDLNITLMNAETVKPSVVSTTSWNNYRKAVEHGQEILTTREVTQAQVEEAYNAIKYFKYEYTSANYSKVTLLANQANALNPNHYTNFAQLQTVLDGINWNLDLRYQSTVDGYETALTNAINALVLKDADYTAVETAKNAANALKAEDYQDFTAVTNAVNAVVYGYKADKQTDVDAMAKAINDAIAALVSIYGDYSVVETAKSKIPADLSIYTDDTVAVLNTALSNVVYGLDSFHQNEINAYAKAIDDAVTALILKKANYTNVTNAIAAANSLTPSNYTNFEAVTNAISAVVNDLDITKQGEVDDMATAINNAIAALIWANADYTALDNAISQYENTDLSTYTLSSSAIFTDALSNAKAVNRELTKKDQTTVDNAANALTTAFSQLEKLADYSALNSIISAANSLTQTADYIANYYTDESVNKLTNALTDANNVNKDLAIKDQGIIDNAKNNLQSAMTSLKLKDADKTALNNKINYAKSLKSNDYTVDSWSAMQSELSNADNVLMQTGLTIKNQSVVDTALNNLELAISNLVERLSVTFKVTGKGKISYGDTEITSSQLFRFDLNDQFTATAINDENSSFMYWVDENGRIVSYSHELTKLALYSTSYTAVFQDKADAAVYTVTFLGKNNAVLSIQKVNEGEDATAPELPYYDGYRAIGWSGTFTCVTSDVTVRANYEPVEVTYTVTAAPDVTITGNPLQDGKYTFNSKVIFELDDYTNFKGWSVDGGKTIISYNEVYVVYVGCDMNVTYVTKGADETVTPEPVVAITDVTVTKDSIAHVAVLVERTAPEGKFELVNAGLIFTVSDKELTLESANANSDVFVKNTTNVSPSGQYKLTINLAKSATLSFRGYAVYKNIETGEIVTVYSTAQSHNIQL